MSRVHPETELERKLMCLGAVFVEEDHVLDDLYEVIGSDLVEGQELQEDVKEQVLSEVGEYFLRMDMNLGPEAQWECVEILQEMWGVRDKASALKNLENIRQQGHRTKFNVLKSVVQNQKHIDGHILEKFKQIFEFDFSPAHEIKMADEDYRKLAEWMQRTDKYLTASGILAWDVARAVHLTRLCFVAGFFNDNEAWAEILHWAPLIEDHYPDWTSYAQSFLIGCTFWAGSEDPHLKKICERLLGHPASPWLFYSWT